MTLYRKISASNPLAHILNAYRLIGSNYKDWLRNYKSSKNFVYFITFTDDLSRYGYVYLMRHKSEAFEKFKKFRHEVEKQTKKSIEVL